MRALKPDAILHGGDIGDLAVLEQLAEVAPVYAVRGNIDTRAPRLPDVLTIDVGPLRILLTHIAVYGPKLRAEVAKRAREEKARARRVRALARAVHRRRPRASPCSTRARSGRAGSSCRSCSAQIDITPKGVKLAHINCETGERWLPP